MPKWEFDNDGFATRNPRNDAGFVSGDMENFERHPDYIPFIWWSHPGLRLLQQLHRYVKNGLLPADWGGDLGEMQGRFGE